MLLVNVIVEPKKCEAHGVNVEFSSCIVHLTQQPQIVHVRPDANYIAAGQISAFCSKQYQACTWIYGQEWCETAVQSDGDVTS